MDDQATPQRTSSSGKGCLIAGIGGGCLVILLACGGLIGFGVLGAFGMMKSSDPYQQSLQRAQQNTEIQQALGEPIDAAFLVSGNISFENSDGEADLRYSVSGPNGSAQIHVVGTKTDGEWTYEIMDATVDETGTKVDLKTAN